MDIIIYVEGAFVLFIRALVPNVSIVILLKAFSSTKTIYFLHVNNTVRRYYSYILDVGLIGSRSNDKIIRLRQSWKGFNCFFGFARDIGEAFFLMTLMKAFMPRKLFWMFKQFEYLLCINIYIRATCWMVNIVVLLTRPFDWYL